jgi:hypothetical protein
MFKWLCMRSLKEHWAQSSENKPARMSDAELTNTPADAGIPVRSATAERTRAHVSGGGRQQSRWPAHLPPDVCEITRSADDQDYAVSRSKYSKRKSIL